MHLDISIFVHYLLPVDLKIRLELLIDKLSVLQMFSFLRSVFALWVFNGPVELIDQGLERQMNFLKFLEIYVDDIRAFLIKVMAFKKGPYIFHFMLRNHFTDMFERLVYIGEPSDVLKGLRILLGSCRAASIHGLCVSQKFADFDLVDITSGRKSREKIL